MHLIKEMDVLQAVNMYLYEPLVCQGEENVLLLEGRQATWVI